VQFDGEKADKITRGACACNDDKVIFENPLIYSAAVDQKVENLKHKQYHRSVTLRRLEPSSFPNTLTTVRRE